MENNKQLAITLYIDEELLAQPDVAYAIHAARLRNRIDEWAAERQFTPGRRVTVVSPADEDGPRDITWGTGEVVEVAAGRVKVHFDDGNRGLFRPANVAALTRSEGDEMDPGASDR